jgi:hypothetical protein
MRRRIAAPLVAAALAACSGASEHPVVDRFFTASRLHDKTALSAIATVALDPLTVGTVTDFSIVKIDAEPGPKSPSSETVTVDARVHVPSGQMVRRKIVLTLRRGPSGGWIVTGVMIASAL